MSDDFVDHFDPFYHDPFYSHMGYGNLTVREPDFPHKADGPVSQTVDELKEKIVENIRTIYDPEIPINIWEVGLIYSVDVSQNGFCSIVMTLTSPNCPSAAELPAMVQRGASMVPGIQAVALELTFDPPWTPERMSEDAKLLLDL